MGEKVGIELLYDTKKAESNNANLSKSFANMESSNKGAAKAGGFAMATAVALGNIMTQGFNTLTSKIGGAIPALGETLSQAGSVIFNNLFKPLSDVLMPMLRDLMNWVRDNRTGFLKLGSVIANVFKAIVSIVKAVFGIISDVFTTLFGKVKGGAKGAFSGIADFLNLVLLKIVFIVQFVLAAVGAVIQDVAEGAKSLFGGIAEGAKGAFSGIGEAWDELYTAMGGKKLSTKEQEEKLKAFQELQKKQKELRNEALKGIGQGIGNFFKDIGQKIKNAMKGFTGLTNGIKTAIGWLKEQPEKIKAAFNNAMSSIKNFFGSVGDWIMNKWNAVIDWFKKLPEKISQAVSDAWDKVKESGKELFEMLNPLNSGDKYKKLLEAKAKAQGGGGSVSTSNNQQNNNYHVTANGSPDPAADAVRMATQMGGGNNIKNMQAARGEDVQ